jgi:hypothetical protein
VSLSDICSAAIVPFTGYLFQHLSFFQQQVTVILNNLLLFGVFLFLAVSTTTSSLPAMLSLEGWCYALGPSVRHGFSSWLQGVYFVLMI